MNSIKSAKIIVTLEEGKKPVIEFQGARVVSHKDLGETVRGLRPAYLKYIRKERRKKDA